MCLSSAILNMETNSYHKAMNKLIIMIIEKVTRRKSYLEESNLRMLLPPIQLMLYTLNSYS
jgi:hypothetical protein